MAEMIRMLVVNDTFASKELDVQKLPHTDKELDIRFVGNDKEAIAQLDEWAKEGHTADIVTIDMHEQAPGSLYMKPVGRGHLKTIEQWQTDHPNFAPKKYFFHSAGDEETAPNVSFHDMHDLSSLRTLCSGNFRHLILGGTPALLKYFNDTWHTNFPLKDSQVKEYTLDVGGISPDNAIDNVSDQKYTQFEAVKGINLNKLNLRPSLKSWGYEGGSENFLHNTLGATNGYLAFDAADVEMLRQQKKPVILAVEDLQSISMELLPKLSGVIVLGKGTQHSKPILEAHGIVAAFDNSEGSLKIEENDGKKYLVRPANPEEEKIAYKLGAGDAVSMDDRWFYHTHLPMLEGNISHDAYALANWSDRLRQENGGLEVKANSDYRNWPLPRVRLPAPMFQAPAL